MAVPRFRITERQVLMLLLVASVLGFAGAFLLASFRQHGARLERTSQPRVRWMPPPTATGATSMTDLIADLFDPSLMALPNPRGFSLRLWQRRTAPPARVFDPPSELALLDPPALDPLPAMLLQSPLETGLQTGIEKLPATLLDLNSSELQGTAGTQSTMHLNGDLASRALLEQPSLPASVVAAGVRPTRVRLAVGVDGRVRYASVDRSSGNEDMDAQALELARRLRFDSVSSADPLALAWGTARFNWASR